jgi:phosphoribosyl 1,2-cyclic phosphodiesterase
MKLKILGSSSAGNCYILENESEALVLEAGVRFDEVKRALDFNIAKVVGCLISHEHNDHAGELGQFIAHAIPCYASLGTIEAKGYGFGHILQVIQAVSAPYEIGSFKVLVFHTRHDAAEPLGFFINHPETGNVLFATDTFYLPRLFSGLSNILIEANYRTDILEENARSGRISEARRNRTLQSHMSYETCLEALLANDLSKVNNIVLIHLSNDNSNAVEFQEGIRKATCKTTRVADKGMVLNFNKTPL